MRGAAIVLCVLAGCAAGPVRHIGAIAASAYSEAQDPEGNAAWQRAQLAVARGAVANALPDLRTAVERCPDLVRAHMMFQDSARQVGGDAEKAMLAYYGALPLRETPVPAYVKARLASTSYDKGEELERILRRDPSFGWAHLSLGRVRRGQGRFQLAADAFHAAYVHDAGLHEARLERADALAELGRLEEAAVDYEAYFQQAPDDFRALRDYAAMLIYRLIRIDRALELLARLETRFPGDADLRMHRAAAMWRARRPREAIAGYLAVLDQDPKAARAALNIGLIYYDALPNNEAERRTYWPRARAAFRYFLALGEPQDGHEAFERTLAVPFRLGRIEDVLGPDGSAAVTVDDLRLPPG